MKEILKIIAHSFLFLLRGLSYAVPRKKSKWAVGSAKGFCDNSKYFFLHAKEVLHKEDCCWICKNKKANRSVRKLGFKAYHPWSPKGLYHQLTSGVFIYDTRPSALNYWVSGGAGFVNLWHGVGIKYCEFAGKVNAFKPATLKNKLRHPDMYHLPDIFLSTSPMMTAHFCNCFRMSPGRCIESSYPRCDIFKYSPERLHEFIRRYEPPETGQLVLRLQQAARSYIYMPTWRDVNENFLETAGFRLEELNRVLRERNELFLFKLHPFTRVRIDTQQYDRILLLESRMDIYPVLPFTDVLITDYSSIYYDYLLIPDKETLLFPFDYHTYIREDRDLAFDFDEYTPGARVYTFGQLLEKIRSGARFPNEKREWILDKFWNSPRHEELYQAVGKWKK